MGSIPDASEILGQLEVGTAELPYQGPPSAASAPAS